MNGILKIVFAGTVATSTFTLGISAPVKAETAVEAIPSEWTSDDIGDELRAIEVGNRADALIEALAERTQVGDTAAMRLLGGVYRDGRLVQKDVGKALKFFEQAMESGDKSAFIAIGDLYARNGTVLGVDPAEAVGFYQKGVDAGDRWAMASLGDVYREGKIVPQDLKKALALYLQAANLGINAVNTKLGDLYARNGTELGVDPAEAVGFYQKGVDAGDRWAMASLGDVYREGKIVPQDLKKALALYLQASSAGHTGVFTKIAEIYYRNAPELKLDPTLALGFYEKGAENGDSWSLVGLGDLYREGRVIANDTAKALAYYEAAMIAGNKRAYILAADMLLKGSAADQARGLELVKTAVTNKIPAMASVWADAHLYGRGVPANPKTAVKILREASEQGDLDATIRLVQIYAEGVTGIPKNPKGAAQLLDEAEDRLAPERLAQEQIFLLGITATTSNQMQDFVARLDQLPPADQAYVVGRISWRNENAFVFALQKLMQENGTYRGPLNGILTSSTIAGLNRECLKLSRPSVCDAGPLSREVRPLLISVFRTREGS